MKIRQILTFCFLFCAFTVFAQPKLIPYLKGEKWGYCDSKKNLKIPAIYDEAMPFDGGLAVVSKSGKQGMIDESGAEVIPFKYSYIYNFSDGLAMVVDGQLKSGYINRKGEEVIKCQFSSASSFKEERAQVGNYGNVYVIDTKGNRISSDYSLLNAASEGYMAFQENRKWGLLDKDGKEVVAAKYYEIGAFSEGLVAVQEDVAEGIGFINTKGELVIPFQFENAWIPNFSEGLAAVSKGGKYGFINTKGEWVIEAQYDYAVGFSEGLSCVYKDGRLGFVDKKGKLVIPYKYKSQIEGDFNFYFSNGLCAVYDPEAEGGGMGFIDKKGKKVIPFDFPYLGSYVVFDASGLALVSTPDYYLVTAYIDKKGRKYWEGVKAPVEEEEDGNGED